MPIAARFTGLLRQRPDVYVGLSEQCLPILSQARLLAFKQPALANAG
jgi:hypothetical protein